MRMRNGMATIRLCIILLLTPFIMVTCLAFALIVGLLGMFCWLMEGNRYGTRLIFDRFNDAISFPFRTVGRLVDDIRDRKYYEYN